MNITLTPDIERGLAEEARTLGTTPEMLALTYLKERFVAPVTTDVPIEEYESLADFLEGYVGVLSSSELVPGGARMSQNVKEKFIKDIIGNKGQVHRSRRLRDG